MGKVSGGIGFLGKTIVQILQAVGSEACSSDWIIQPGKPSRLPHHQPKQGGRIAGELQSTGDRRWRDLDRQVAKECGDRDMQAGAIDRPAGTTQPCVQDQGSRREYRAGAAGLGAEEGKKPQDQSTKGDATDPRRRLSIGVEGHHRQQEAIHEGAKSVGVQERPHTAAIRLQDVADQTPDRIEPDQHRHAAPKPPSQLEIAKYKARYEVAYRHESNHPAAHPADPRSGAHPANRCHDA